MKQLRDIWTELVDRRLWPVALVLVAALVAIPVVLAKSPPADNGSGVQPPVVVAAAAAVPDTPIVSVAGSAPKGAALGGTVKNPFRQQHVPKAASSDSGSSPVNDGTGSGGAPSGSGGSGGVGGSGGSGGGQKTYVRAAIDVNFQKATSEPHAITDVPRLTPLPAASNPVVVFLGMRPDQQTAVFLVSSDVHAQGDGKCLPLPQTCQTIELKQDQVAFLDVTAPNGRVTQWELDLVKVTLTQTTSKADAQDALAPAAKPSVAASGSVAAGEALGEAEATEVVAAP